MQASRVDFSAGHLGFDIHCRFTRKSVFTRATKRPLYAVHIRIQGPAVE